jgi:endogenous inhibitor of DNA gyrase (YacG/DUF329 family)
MSTTAKCADCGKEVKHVPKLEDRLPCPNCGSKSRQVSVVIEETVTLSDSVKVSKTRHYYEKNKKISIILVIIWLASSILGYQISGILGLVVGILLGGLAFVVPSAVTKVKEIEHL